VLTATISGAIEARSGYQPPHGWFRREAVVRQVEITSSSVAVIRLD